MKKNVDIFSIRKDIWSLICLRLDLKDILNLSLVDKKLERNINSNNLIWKNLSSDGKFQNKENINENLFKAVYPLQTYKLNKNIFFVRKDEWLKERDCEEKKTFIEDYLQSKHGEKLITLNEKKIFEFLEKLDQFISFQIYTLPLPFFLFFFIVSLIHFGFVSLPYSFSLLPVLYLFFSFVFYLMMHFWTNKKKWRNYFYWNFNLRNFSSKGGILLVTSIFLLFSSIILTVLKIDGDLDFLSNKQLILIWFSFSLCFFMCFISEWIKKKNTFFFVCSFISFIILSLFFLVELNLMGFFSEEYKWSVTFVPVFVLDLLVSLFTFFLAFKAMKWRIKNELAFNFTFILATFSFVSSNIFLLLHLVNNSSHFNSFLIAIQIFFLSSQFFYFLRSKKKMKNAI